MAPSDQILISGNESACQAFWAHARPSSYFVAVGRHVGVRRGRGCVEREGAEVLEFGRVWVVGSETGDVRGGW